jgi:hypothetical protein
MFDGHIVVYKFIQDLHFFVTGGEEENELILASVLQGFTDAVDIILRLYSTYLMYLCFSTFYFVLHLCPYLIACILFPVSSVSEITSTKEQHSKIWISSYCASMKLLMEGKS